MFFQTNQARDRNLHDNSVTGIFLGERKGTVHRPSFFENQTWNFSYCGVTATALNEGEVFGERDGIFPQTSLHPAKWVSPLMLVRFFASDAKAESVKTNTFSNKRENPATPLIADGVAHCERVDKTNRTGQRHN